MKRPLKIDGLESQVAKVPFWAVWLGAAIGIVLIAGILKSVLEDGADRKLPEFGEIHDIRERKAAFFNYMEPLIRSENSEIQANRQRLLLLRQRFESGPLSYRDRYWLRQLAESYDMHIVKRSTLDLSQFDRLLRRVDTIPPSLALAQAAIESGWGSSRVAKEGNNLFGMWCYKPGCGMVPRKRAKGATHEVKRYASPQDSMREYMHNLNTNPAYAELRRIRSKLRMEGSALDGLTVAGGLYRYSGRGWAYVDKVRQFIRSNNVEIFDETQN